MAERKHYEERICLPESDMNSIARRIVDEQRGKHRELVFTYRGKPTKSILNSGWKLARARAGLAHVRVYDLRHTYGHRLFRV